MSKLFPGTTATEYLGLVEKRFANSTIRDTTRRVAFDGSSRHPGFLLPSLRDALASGRSLTGLALAEAFWCRMCAGVREDGSEIAPNDPQWEHLQNTARASKADPKMWIEQRQYYGELAGNTPVCRSVFRLAVHNLASWLPSSGNRLCHHIGKATLIVTRNWRKLP